MMDDLTLFEKRKRDMMELWKETFHDSDRYIELVFDNYFSLPNSFVRYDENRIIAAMLCVPYEFQILTKEGKKARLRGMYLCGLATHPEWRRRGIMSELMDEAEEAFQARGYDLAFLIPADDHLREYYRRKGYETASWREHKIFNRREDSFISDPQAPHIYTIKEFFNDDKNEFLNQLADWCREIELMRQNNTIVHSREDFVAIMAENENSIFLTNPSFDLKYPNLAKVLAVAFPELPEGSDESLRVVGLYMSNNSHDEPHDKKKSEDEEERNESGERLHNLIASEVRDAIMRKFDRSKLDLILPSTREEIGGRIEVPYAMVKLFQKSKKYIADDIPKFEISLMLD